MRIIWVKAGKFFSGRYGRPDSIIQHPAALGRTEEVVFLSYYPGDRDDAYERELAARFPCAVSFPAGASAERFAQALHDLKRLPGAAPYAVAKFTAPSVQRRVLEIIEQQQADVAIV